MSTNKQTIFIIILSLICIVWCTSIVVNTVQHLSVVDDFTESVPAITESVTTSPAEITTASSTTTTVETSLITDTETIHATEIIPPTAPATETPVITETVTVTESISTTESSTIEIIDPPVVADINEFEVQVVNLINAIRVQYDLPTLNLNVELCKVARAKAQDMHDKGYFSHTSPTYGSPFDMMRAFGITYWMAGENIAMGQNTPEFVVECWMNSEGHRANILTEGFTQIGMGYVMEGNYWVQMFIG